jgi:hypothetical protein
MRHWEGGDKGFFKPSPERVVEKPALERGTAEVQRSVRVVGLDVLSLRMFTPMGQYILQMTPATAPAELRVLLNSYLTEIGTRSAVWTHHIRHKQTLDVLRAEFPELPPKPNYAPYKYRSGDVLLVAVLKRRPTKRDPCVPATPEDLAYWFVAVRRKIPVLTPADAIPKL